MNAINAIRVRILLFLALIVLGACSRVEGGVPNILFIMADDLGIGDLSSHGANDMRTPHIDRLMASGCRFSNAYAKFVQSVPRPARHFSRDVIPTWWVFPG